MSAAPDPAHAFREALRQMAALSRDGAPLDLVERQWGAAYLALETLAPCQPGGRWHGTPRYRITYPLDLALHAARRERPDSALHHINRCRQVFEQHRSDGRLQGSP